MNNSTSNILRLFLIGMSVVWLLACDGKGSLPEVDLSERLSDAEVRELVPLRPDSSTFIFSFELRNTPLEDIRQYLPLLDYLRKKTSYKFEIQLSTDVAMLNTRLLHKQIDFVAIGGMNYVNMARKFHLTPLVRGINFRGKSEYQAAIVVGFNSTVKKISQLKGKRFAFGSRYSTQGYLLPRMMLSRNGIELGDLESYGFTGTHQACADAVIGKEYDACGMQDTLAQSLAEQGLVRILALSPYYPSSAIAVAPNVPKDVQEAVRRALIDFEPQGKDKALLYHWELTEMPLGFVEASADDYKVLEKLMRRFDLLDEATIPVEAEPVE